MAMVAGMAIAAETAAVMGTGEVATETEGVTEMEEVTEMEAARGMAVTRAPVLPTGLQQMLVATRAMTSTLARETRSTEAARALRCVTAAVSERSSPKAVTSCATESDAQS